MPFINNRFYMNPAYGRAIQKARIAKPGIETSRDAQPSGAQDAQRPNSGGHWVTIDHHHVLIDGTRQRIADAARKHLGSTDWAFDKRKGNFPSGTNKCNKFVYDATREAGAPAVVIGKDGRPRAPLAGEWADPKTAISGWRVLGPNETPQPGDVAAWPHHYSDATGHSGIVVSVDQNGHVTAIAAHDRVVGTDDSFNRSVQPKVRYRRYIGR